MNGQYYGDRFQPSEKIEDTNPETSTPTVNSDSFADKYPVDAALVHETPMGGTLAAAGPMDEPYAAEIPLLETPNQEIPLGGTVAAAGPMDEPYAAEIPVYEAPVRVIPVGEAVPAVGLMNEAIVREGPISTYTAPDVKPVPADYVVSEPVVYKAPIDEPVAHEVPVAVAAALAVPLLNHDESELFRTHWNEIQGKFVDDPRIAVQQADALVAEVVTHLTQMFATEHSTLESQWKQGSDVSTEDLRKALQHYRSFFNRLVV